MEGARAVERALHLAGALWQASEKVEMWALPSPHFRRIRIRISVVSISRTFDIALTCCYAHPNHARHDKDKTKKGKGKTKTRPKKDKHKHKDNTNTKANITRSPTSREFIVASLKTQHNTKIQHQNTTQHTTKANKSGGSNWPIIRPVPLTYG
jgi:hypothetical protein